ncbi:hypothetical protein DM01DRAFT_1404281 [Hesseltinella vesiculosa]|uniref:Uncharacterized protein n=1 Tax=Hesseltinella vesiculosa TaxID=101127 RepID=A0A1X2GTY6_9FUNG|nr:hypothetical protein DM01DRAFT_1404281 [Hesseltinella vesiculosa]
MRHSFAIFFLLAVLACLVQGQGISRSGKKDGMAIMKHAANVGEKAYHIRNVKTKKYLAFLPGTLAEPSASQKSADTAWTLKRYQNKLYSFNHDHGSLKKCLSARWTNGKDDAAVMWQCELKYGNHKRDVVDKRYTPIKWQKQVWTMVPVRGHKNTFKIFAYTHIFDMTPTCLSGTSTGGNSYRGGTVLKKCKLNSNDPSLYWTFSQ